ncbi:MAG: hypothetical protein HY690_15530, partial [Chloroflexi bacterium]|nr:hypothetical protein [Chloroflexota bacterium]
NRDTRPTGGWLDASENRRGGALPACPAELVTAALLLQVPVAGVGALFLGLALPIPGREATPDVEALRGLAWLPLLVVPAGLVQACWRASGRVRLAAAAGATGSTFQAGLAVAALAAGAGLPGATAALVAAQAATTLAHLLLGRATGVGSSVPRALRWRATLAHAGRLGRAGLPVVLSAALGIVQLRADLAVLGWSAGATALGGYVLARKLLDALLLLPQAYFAAAFPRRLQSGRMQRGSGRALLGASVLLAGGVALAAGPILGALSGRVPDGAPATLGLLALALPLTAATTLLSLELLAERRYGVVGLLSAAAAALAVALNVLLDGHWAASGAALAAVLSEAAVLPLYWLAARRQRLAVQATSRQVVA